MTCPCCSATYDLDTFLALSSVRLWDFGCGETHIIAECAMPTCRSTLHIPVLPVPAWLAEEEAA